ncbi:MAG: cation:proton antiporter [Robiginitomaculum sp.]|nr:MAG: cation:proton antiporter [Robiginitomaculum sp.]
MIRSALVLLVLLSAFWLALSGYLDNPVLLTVGAISVLLVVAMVWRMKIIDTETVPYLHGKSLGYFAWMFVQITKSNIEVVKAVLSPDMEISPKLTKVPMPHSTDLGRVTFANSITLTPGTVSVEMQDDVILVHALLASMTDPKAFADMGERAAWAVSDPMLSDPMSGKSVPRKDNK